MTQINIERAKLSPDEIFKSPMAVVNNKDLSRKQQIEILRSWAYNERELQVAEEENMLQRGVERPNKLAEVLQALAKLGVFRDLLESPPTKQGGD